MYILNNWKEKQVVNVVQMLTTNANGVDPSSNVVESKSLCAGKTFSDVPARLKHT